MQFIKLREINEHEGETWRFWLQVDGNEAELKRLRTALERVAELYGDQYDVPFELSDQPKSEAYVDALVEEAEGDDDGYMAAHHKVTGVLTVPDWPDLAPDDYDNAIERALYKGGIRKLFRETASA